MTSYKARNIEYNELLKVNDWFIKVYTITKHDTFNDAKFYEDVKLQIPKWITLKNGFNHNHNNIGFLILHRGTEGIFSLINWWIGDNMLNTHIFKTDYNQPISFDKISGDGLAPCVWELEIINHERVAWTNHVLKKAPQPDFESYLKSSFSKTL